MFLSPKTCPEDEIGTFSHDKILPPTSLKSRKKSRRYLKVGNVALLSSFPDYISKNEQHATQNRDFPGVLGQPLKAI